MKRCSPVNINILKWQTFLSFVSAHLFVKTLSYRNYSCDDFQSCSSINYNQTSPFNYQQTVLCNGANTCNSSFIKSYDLVCEGNASCQYATVQSADILTCTGHRSCINASSSASNGMTCDGYYACFNSNISVDVTDYNDTSINSVVIYIDF